MQLPVRALTDSTAVSLLPAARALEQRFFAADARSALVFVIIVIVVVVVVNNAVVGGSVDAKVDRFGCLLKSEGVSE